MLVSGAGFFASTTTTGVAAEADLTNWEKLLLNPNNPPAAFVGVFAGAVDDEVAELGSCEGRGLVDREDVLAFAVVETTTGA